MEVINLDQISMITGRIMGFLFVFEYRYLESASLVCCLRRRVFS